MAITLSAKANIACRGAVLAFFCLKRLFLSQMYLGKMSISSSLWFFCDSASCRMRMGTDNWEAKYLYAVNCGNFQCNATTTIRRADMSVRPDLTRLLLADVLPFCPSVRSIVSLDHTSTTSDRKTALKNLINV